MLQGQDIVLLLKLLSDKKWLVASQQKIAAHLYICQSEINHTYKRLIDAKLIYRDHFIYIPDFHHCAEYLLTVINSLINYADHKFYELICICDALIMQNELANDIAEELLLTYLNKYEEELNLSLDLL